MMPWMYRVRIKSSLRKFKLRPACFRLSGAVGASGTPMPSQSTLATLFWLAIIPSTLELKFVSYSRTDARFELDLSPPPQEGASQSHDDERNLNHPRTIRD